MTVSNQIHTLSISISQWTYFTFVRFCNSCFWFTHSFGGCKCTTVF